MQRYTWTHRQRFCTFIFIYLYSKLSFYLPRSRISNQSCEKSYPPSNGTASNKKITNPFSANSAVVYTVVSTKDLINVFATIVPLVWWLFLKKSKKLLKIRQSDNGKRLPFGTYFWIISPNTVMFPLWFFVETTLTVILVSWF